MPPVKDAPEPTERGSYTRTLNSLGSRIVRGELAPGQSLDIVAVGAEYGASRTVVREAVRVLAAKGLVDARPRRGTLVQPRQAWAMLDADVLRWRFGEPGSPQFLDQLFEIRLMVEPSVAGFAAMRRDDDDLADLHRALGAMRSATTSAEHVEADLAFHRALLVASHNELIEHMATVIEVGLRIRDRIVHNAISEAAVDEHEAVLDAVRSRRRAAAESAMRALLTRSAADVQAAREALTASRASGST